MSRVTISDEWTSRDDQPTVRGKILEFFTQSGMSVTDNEPDEIVAEQGSRLETCLLGGGIVDPKSLPRRALVSLIPIASGVRIRATIEESFGFGMMDREIRARYRGVCEELMVELRRAVE